MTAHHAHWTETSVDNFLYGIGADFIRQIEKKMDTSGPAQGELAAKLGVSEGRVSQVINNPGNLTLRTVVQYARALGLKVAIVAYSDDDPNNIEGPVNGEIFSACWEYCQKPTDFFALREVKTQKVALTPPRYVRLRNNFIDITNAHAETLSSGVFEGPWLQGAPLMTTGASTGNRRMEGNYGGGISTHV